MAQPARLLLVFVALVALARPAAAQADPAARPTPVLDNVDLMDLMVKPAYDEVQKALAHVPEDRKGWRAEAARKPEWAEACTACHHAFAREAPVITP